VYGVGKTINEKWLINEIGVDAEEYYRIKDSEKKAEE